MTRDLGIDKLELGIIFSAFGWSYVVAQMPGGWLLDRFGARKVYLLAIIVWSLLTAAHGLVALVSGAIAVAMLFALRFLVGIAEAPALPGNARIVSQWFPAHERGTAAAIFNSAQYFSTVLFAPLMGWIVVTWGWQWNFAVMGLGSASELTMTQVQMELAVRGCIGEEFTPERIGRWLSRRGACTRTRSRPGAGCLVSSRAYIRWPLQVATWSDSTADALSFCHATRCEGCRYATVCELLAPGLKSRKLSRGDISARSATA